ncbi:MAG: hypothetical protein AB1938_31600 [Myxococcota bacterium]
MLSLLSAVVLAQSPITVQALVPTSGDGAEALLDGKPDTGWTPAGDPLGEGVLVRFEDGVPVKKISARACPGKKVRVRPFVNGSEYPSKEVGPEGKVLADFAQPRKLRSLFLRLDDAGAGACLAEVTLEDDKPVALRAPRTIKARAAPSSVLEPADAYHPGYLFDGRLDFGWVEGAKGPGVGESMTITFEQPVTVTALELWNGYQRSDDHFAKNARAKKLAVALDGAAPVDLLVKDEQGAQKLALPKPVAVKSLTLTVKEVYPGSRYEDLVLSELRVWDAEGPRAIVTGDLPERAAALKQQLSSQPMATFVDATFRAACEVEGRELSAKFRSNHSFVVYRSIDDDAGALKEVLDGTWIVKDPKTIELFGRAHRTETSYDPYASESEKDSTTIIGGPVTVTRVADLKKDGYQKALARLLKSPARWSLKCPAAKDFDALVAKDAFVVEGRAVTGILTR